jgi:hypothetical protein
MDSWSNLPKFDGVSGLTPEEFDNILMGKAIDFVWTDDETAANMCK